MKAALLLLFPLAAFAGPSRVDEVAAHYRNLNGLAPEATGSSLTLVKGVAEAESHLLGQENGRAFLAARAAWQYLASGDGENPSRRLAQLIYNLACSACAAEADWSKFSWEVAGTTVALERRGFLAQAFEEFRPACLQSSEGFGDRVTIAGSGGPVVAIWPRSEERDEAWPYLPPVDFAYPATAVLSFGGEQARLVLHDPLGETFAAKGPLEIDFTAGIQVEIL